MYIMTPALKTSRCLLLWNIVRYTFQNKAVDQSIASFLQVDRIANHEGVGEASNLEENLENLDLDNYRDRHIYALTFPQFEGWFFFFFNNCGII